ncbi:MAG: DUF4286 family protein [Bacteroidales bacterium]|nr:DUF4286 family protein [Bacteroidales bacterium]
MLIFNTTFHAEMEESKNLIIYLQEKYIPEAQKSGVMRNARMSRIISNQEDGTESFCVQFEVEEMAQLHKWYTSEGTKLNNEMSKLYNKKVISFPTVMEVME